jgi:branched-chain amino acid transport system ATP-binding protein
MTALLEMRGGTVRFGGVTALDRFSFVLGRGELLGLIGPNGAGKSTAMRVVTGVVQPQAGTVLLDGESLDGLPVHRRVRAGLGLSQQLVRPFRAMTLVDNVALAVGHDILARPWAAMRHMSRRRERARAREWLDAVGIGDHAGRRPDEVPLGVLKRLEMARALALEPKVVLLDEPLAGLNHLEARRLADTIRTLNDDGLSIVLIEHNLGEVMRICARLVVLDNGRGIADGEPRAVMKRADVRAAYVGREADVA